MKLNTTLFWQVLLVFAIIFIGVGIAAQWTAAQLAYSPRLGAPWFVVFETPIYPPYRFFAWWYSYEAYAPDVFDRGGQIAAGSGILGAIIAVIGSVFRSRQAGTVTTYGSARWASPAEIREAGIMADGGVFLGQHGKTYLRHNGPEHVLAFAPTRSGKGVGLVVPTLLSWPHSTVVHDIKGENWDLTAGWRSSFSDCLRFDPTDMNGARYNPLLEVRKGPNEYRDVQNIADILIDPEGRMDWRSHWEKTAKQLLVAVILHVLYAEADKTLSRVSEILSDPTCSLEESIERMMGTNHLGTHDGPRVHPRVARGCRKLLSKTGPERSGVVSTTLSFLELYDDPIAADVTSRCDFRIDDLIHGERPISLYIVVPPSDITRTKPLVRLLLNQIGRRLTEKHEAAADRRQLLLMLDEFPALGRLDFFESELGFMASYGLRAFLIAQSLNQIEKAYGPKNAIMDGCHIRVAFATNDEQTAKRVSESLGTKTEQRTVQNYTGHRLAPWLSHVMKSRQETARPLLTPGEIMQLPADDEIVLVSGAPPIRAKKLRYYEDRNFLKRRCSAPEATGRLADGVRRDDWGQGVCEFVEDLLPSDVLETRESRARQHELGKEKGKTAEREHSDDVQDGDAAELERPRGLFGDRIAEADSFDATTNNKLFGRGR